MHLPLLDFDSAAARWAVICIAIITILWATMRPFLRKKDPLSKAPGYASLARQRSVEQQMQNVLVEMSEMTRQIAAQLDTRAAKLEALIREADEKIAAMKSASEAPPSGAGISVPPPPPLLDPRHAQVYALADQG